MDLLKLLHRGPEETWLPERPRLHGGLIRCQDCGCVGHIWFRGLSPVLPSGWAMAWVGLRPLYTCPKCGAKRVGWVREHVLHPSAR